MVQMRVVCTVPRRAAGDKRAYERLETEPGLDRFADDGEGAPPLRTLGACAAASVMIIGASLGVQAPKHDAVQSAFFLGFGPSGWRPRKCGR